MTGNNDNGGFTRQIVHNLIILDESGSMGAIKHATIQGFNELVQSIRGIESKYPEQAHYVSLVTFNSLGIKTKLFAEKVKNLWKLDADSYVPDEATPLYDAIGYACKKLLNKVGVKKDTNVLVTILTDGEENNSKEYSEYAISKLIESLAPKGWTFTYIGANHDVEAAAARVSIQNHLDFDADETGILKCVADDMSARERYADRIHRGEDLRTGYFEDKG